MPTDADFLRTLHATPADDTARLVYADWLEEQDDAAAKSKAEFVRLELRVAKLPAMSFVRRFWTGKLQRLAAELEPDWLAVVSHPPLEACRVQFEFECPKQWDGLTPTADAKVRHCASCERNVYYCDTLADARRHAAAGECVAVTPALARQPGDLFPPARMTLGGIRLTRGITLPRGDRPLTPPGTPADPTVGGEARAGDDVEPPRRGRSKPPRGTRRQSRRLNRNVSPDDPDAEG